jgi:hypothetical protein
MQFTIFAPNHTVNCCMAYHIKYAKHHRYDDSATFAEEDSFTKNFSEPMVPIAPESSVLQMCHAGNTYNKRELLLNNLCMEDDPRRNCVRTSHTMEALVRDTEIRADLCALFPPRDTSAFDVVVYCGHLSIEWDPESLSLGGSEQAVVHLSRHWRRSGRTVAVYGRFAFDERDVDGVSYQHWSHFRVKRDYNVLVLWRLFGMHPMLSLPSLRARVVIVDLHDNVAEGYVSVARDMDRVTHVAFKSRFHAHCYAVTTGAPVPESKCAIIPNGIRVDSFSCCPPGVTRQRYRFCYASCYTRGVLPFLKHTWPILRALEPRAEFHMMYGKTSIKDEAFLDELNKAMDQPGVVDHGRVGIDDVVAEKHRSSLHIYFTSSLAEIDCISIRESLVAGCIPVLSAKNLFVERHGLHITLDPDDRRSYTLLAKEILALANRPDLDTLREKIRQSDTIVTWEQVADAWTRMFV